MGPGDVPKYPKEVSTKKMTLKKLNLKKLHQISENPPFVGSKQLLNTVAAYLLDSEMSCVLTKGIL